MSGARDGVGWDEAGCDEAALRLRRLELDNADLHADNARLRASIGEKQREVVAMGERLAQLQSQLAPLHRVVAWARRWRLDRLRAVLRR